MGVIKDWRGGGSDRRVADKRDAFLIAARIRRDKVEIARLEGKPVPKAEDTAVGFWDGLFGPDAIKVAVGGMPLYLYEHLTDTDVEAEAEAAGKVLEDPEDIAERMGYASLDDMNVSSVIDVRDALLAMAAEGGFNMVRDIQILADRISPGHAGQYRDIDSALFGDPAGGSGSGSGRGRSGGGGGGPVYVAPDRRVVEEFVKDKMIVLTGKNQPEFKKVVDDYMRDHKKMAEGASVDPKATVMEGIRGLDEYKRIHKMRQESQDESTWISVRQQRLEQLGLSGANAASRAQAFAAGGVNVNDIDLGAYQYSKGRKDISLMRKLDKVAGQIGRLL
jgi:hypothetical protein